MATILQDKQRDNDDRNQRWARLERADLFARYGDLHAQGVSQRQAAKVLDIPRSTLQAWRLYQDRLDACPAVVAFFHSVPGLAFLHRLVMALHVVCVEMGACGIRLVCLVLELTGLNWFVGTFPGTRNGISPLKGAQHSARQAHTADECPCSPPSACPVRGVRGSYGTQQRVNRRVEEAIVAYRHEESGSCTPSLRLIRQHEIRVEYPSFTTCGRGFYHGLRSLFLPAGADRPGVAMLHAPVGMAQRHRRVPAATGAHIPTAQAPS
jgi:hypothetical protein